MEVRLPEDLSVDVYLRGVFEPGLSTFLVERLKPGMVFFDVGAHFGYFTLLASKLVGHSGAIHAFEPTPSSYELLEWNAARQPNMQPQRLAVWSHAAELELRDFGPQRSMFNSVYAPRLDGDLSYETVKVRAVALDDYVDKTRVVPDFVKIDAESAELQVIEGMHRTIAAHHPMLTVEVGDMSEEQPVSSRELLEQVIALGYSPFEFSDGQIRPHALRERYGYDNILFAP